jgi:hypothetical protein
MGRACGMYGGREQVHTGFWCGKQNETDHLEDLGVDGTIIIKCVSMFHRAFLNSIIDKHQHMHFFTFKTVLV